jgi:hypothetical protein
MLARRRKAEHLSGAEAMARATEKGKQRRKLEERLDEALEETFPASDPFSVGQFTGTEPPSRPVDTEAPAPPVPERRRKKP